MPTRLTLSYYPWITQSISGAALAQAVGVFRDLLQSELRKGMGNAVQIDLLNVMEIPDQLRDMKEKPTGDVVCKIGLLNPIGYAMAHAQVADVQAVAVVRRKIGAKPAGPTYLSQIYTRWDHGIKTLADVRGRSMAFGSTQSTSNFLMPAVMLWEKGIHPLNGFLRVEFTGGHDKAALAVYQGSLDVGAGHDGVILDLASKPGFEDAERKLVRLAWSEPIPSDPVAVNASDPAVSAQVAQALLRVAKPNDSGSDGNKAVLKFWATSEGFDATSPDAYGPLLRLMYPLGLRSDDMLPK
jgi:ABC-type phosphate/phosphonate transport system substrate-binding protein